MLKEAAPLLFKGAWARTVAPSRKVAMPVGVPEAGGTAATVAVNVTARPNCAGLREDCRVVEDALSWSFWMSPAPPGLKLASPL